MYAIQYQPDSGLWILLWHIRKAIVKSQIFLTKIICWADTVVIGADIYGGMVINPNKRTLLAKTHFNDTKEMMR